MRLTIPDNIIQSSRHKLKDYKNYNTWDQHI